MSERRWPLDSEASPLAPEHWLMMALGLMVGGAFDAPWLSIGIGLAVISLILFIWLVRDKGR